MSERPAESFFEPLPASVYAGSPQPHDERDERPWLYALAGCVLFMIGGLLLLPGVPLDQKLTSVMSGICGQTNNLFLGGLQLPICARCTGIYTTFLTTLAYIFLRGRSRAAALPPWHLGAVLVGFVVILGIDGLNSLSDDLTTLHVYQPQNVLRTLSGIGMGISAAVVLLLICNLSLRRNANNQQPILAGWGELLGLLVGNLLLLAGLFGNLTLLYWPVAVLSMVGMLMAFYMINVIICSIMLGYGMRISRLSQLARPALFALFPTVGIISTFAFLRFWLEGQLL